MPSGSYGRFESTTIVRNVGTYGRFLLKFQDFWRVTPCRVAVTDVSKAPRSFETSVPTYQLRRHNFPQNLNFQHHRCENVKSSNLYYEVILCKPPFEILIATR